MKGYVMSGKWRLLVCVPVFVAFFSLWSVLAQEKKEEPQEEKKVTITESQLDQIVERRIAQMMLQEKRSLQERILESQNWHVAIFEGMTYTVYTGPGDVVAAWPYKQPEIIQKEENEKED
jgi:hypothetical protein